MGTQGEPPPKHQGRWQGPKPTLSQVLTMLAEVLRDGYLSRDAPTDGKRGVEVIARISGTTVELVLLAISKARGDLTERERDVYRLAIEGKSNHGMAEEFAISIGTVKAHMRSIFKKLGVRSRHLLELVAFLLDGPPAHDLTPATGDTDGTPVSSSDAPGKARTDGGNAVRCEPGDFVNRQAARSP